MTPEHRLRLVEQELAYLRAEYNQYTSAISHDFAAPLRTMSAFSDIILSQNEAVFDDETKRHFGFIMAGAEKGKTLLTDLREFSQLRKTDADFSAVEGRALVTAVLEELSETFDMDDVDIDMGEFPIVDVDIKQMHLAFFHLLHNALLYRTQTPPVRLSVSCQDSGDFYTFKVTDNGIGVPKNMHETIFQLLKRGVVAADYPGRGMGLAIARKIIRKHGGDIDLMSSMPGETVFRFTLSKNPIVI